MRCQRWGTGGAMDEREDLEASRRASTFFKAASIWRRVESWGGCAGPGGERGATGTPDWPAGVELMGHTCIHRKDGPRSFAPKPHGSLPHALGSRYVAQHGRCAPGWVRVCRVRMVPTGKAHGPGRYSVARDALGPSRPPKGAGANSRPQSISAQATDPGPLNHPGQDERTIAACSRRTALPPHWLIVDGGSFEFRAQDSVNVRHSTSADSPGPNSFFPQRTS